MLLCKRMLTAANKVMRSFVQLAVDSQFCRQQLVWNWPLALSIWMPWLPALPYTCVEWSIQLFHVISCQIDILFQWLRVTMGLLIMCLTDNYKNSTVADYIQLWKERIGWRLNLTAILTNAVNLTILQTSMRIYFIVMFWLLHNYSGSPVGLCKSL